MCEFRIVGQCNCQGQKAAKKDKKMAEKEHIKLLITINSYCQAKPVPKTLPSPNPVKPSSISVQRGTGMTLKSYGPPIQPIHNF